MPNLTEASTPNHISGGDYNNQQSRLEELCGLDYQDFRSILIDIHNTHPKIEPETTFTQQQNQNLGGDKFPRPEDKENLLAHALSTAQTQDDPELAAIIIGASIVAVHPFADGNGRNLRIVEAKAHRKY